MGTHLTCCSMLMAIFTGVLCFIGSQCLEWMLTDRVEITPRITQIILRHLTPSILFAILYFAVFIGYCVIYFHVLYRIYKVFEPRNALLFLILSLSFWAEPVILLTLSSRKPVYPSPREPEMKKTC